MWGEGGLYKQVCDSGEFVGNLWAEREREEGEEEGEGEREGERERQREGEKEGGRVLWALGGNNRDFC